tara:strand:+ start:1069 stop:1386 length:318 start_codon:yes stop_codon:yes gene_type:complete
MWLEWVKGSGDSWGSESVAYDDDDDDVIVDNMKNGYASKRNNIETDTQHSKTASPFFASASGITYTSFHEKRLRVFILGCGKAGIVAAEYIKTLYNRTRRNLLKR